MLRQWWNHVFDDDKRTRTGTYLKVLLAARGRIGMADSAKWNEGENQDGRATATDGKRTNAPATHALSE